jgi:DNA-binding LytR/AlgR family response regulator
MQAPAAQPLQMISAALAGSQGSTLQMVPIADVLYFEAADKYIRVLTANAEFLIRTPLKELLAQLDSNTFWQIHRGTVVRATAIHTVRRDEQGKLTVTLHGNPDKLAVSRIYSHLFKAM